MSVQGKKSMFSDKTMSMRQRPARPTRMNRRPLVNRSGRITGESGREAQNEDNGNIVCIPPDVMNVLSNYGVQNNEGENIWLGLEGMHEYMFVWDGRHYCLGAEQNAQMLPALFDLFRNPDAIIFEMPLRHFAVMES